MKEKVVVEFGFWLVCEQVDILYDFLTIDDGQPLSVDFGLQLNYTIIG